MAENSIIAPLTYGVELEFCVKYSSSLVDPEPNDPRPVRWEGDDLNKPASGHVDMGPKIIDHTAEAFEKHGLRYFRGDIGADRGPQDLDKWEIGFDASVNVRRVADDPYGYEGIEVASPVYFASKQKNMGADEVRRVISIIRNNFRTRVPSSAGLHVHVGDSNRGFSTFHMRNLLSIAYVFEKQISVIHPNRGWVEGDPRNGEMMEYYRIPSRCTLGEYLRGKADRYYNVLYDTKFDLWVDPENENELPPVSDDPPEYSQAQRFLRKEIEKEVPLNHFRTRALFASGPESMSGPGFSNIESNGAGSIAQALFATNHISIPSIPDLDSPEYLGGQLYNHLSSHLTQELDPQITAMLQKPLSQLPSLTAEASTPKTHPDPTLLLAPKLLNKKSSTMTDLTALAGEGIRRRTAYNIIGLIPSERMFTDRKTIEFRQHQGTLDADRVLAWIQMVTGMVEWTRSATPVKIAELLRIGGSVEGETFDVVDLLRFMGLDEPADYYEKELTERRSRVTRDQNQCI